MLFCNGHGMGVISLITALVVLPFRLYLHLLLYTNAELSYQRIPKPSPQILLSSIRYPSLRVRQHRHPKTLSHLLNLILLEYSPNFIHVLSLKGFFLYATPSIWNVLRLEGDELVRISIAEYCHPADLIPLTHELKELSAPSMTGRKTVDLLFRTRLAEGYIWVESHRRLQIELGKGRKVIILSGRVRLMPVMK